MNGGQDTGWIEMVLPLEHLDVHAINLEPPKRLRSIESDTRYERVILPLVYETPVFKMPNLAILTPFMKVHSWDSSTGRLEFDLERDSLTYKTFIEFEQAILQLLMKHPEWLDYKSENLQSHIERHLQYSIVDTILTLYLHGQNTSTKPMGRLWGWKQGLWTKGATQASFKKGQELRVAVRFQGICFFPNAPAKSKYRIQHQTIAVYYKDTNGPTHAQ
jgi:hypothetical protein